MKTIKITELKESTDFKDLYTIGTDENGQSVKISLESVSTNASDALEVANEAKATATEAKESAEQAVKDAQTAIDNAQTAADRANEAAETAETVTEQVQETLAGLVPVSMELDYPPVITIENDVQQQIAVTLLPATTVQNVIFICFDRDVIEVDLKGYITVIGEGTAKVWVIPTCNTSLAQELSISVEHSAIRLVNKDSLRFNESGSMDKS